MKFNEFVKNKRLAKQMPLRKFCKLTSLDPSMWSAIERGVSSHGRNNEVLGRIAKALEFSEADKEVLYNLASEVIEVKETPSEETVTGSLPIFVSTIRGDRLGESEMNLLAQKIQKANTL